MTEEIIDALTRVGGFRVVARTSSFAFRESSRTFARSARS
jgi:TolB-like protein